LTDESNVITNDIPAVPQFLMRETDHHILQAMVTDELDRRASDIACSDDANDTATPSPALDLSSVDLFVPDTTEVSDTLDKASPPPIALNATAAASTSGYSTSELILFRTLTGYRLDTHTPIWRAVDDNGNRVSTADRLFTTLAEEAFRFADRQRRLDGSAQGNLAIEDLALTLSSIRRAASSIGSRGLIAFERLETAIMRVKEETSAQAFGAS